MNHTATVIAGADAVVSAYGPPPDNTDLLIGATERLAEAVSKARMPRLIVVRDAWSNFQRSGATHNN